MNEETDKGQEKTGRDEHYPLKKAAEAETNGSDVNGGDEQEIFGDDVLMYIKEQLINAGLVKQDVMENIVGDIGEGDVDRAEAMLEATIKMMTQNGEVIENGVERGFFLEQPTADIPDDDPTPSGTRVDEHTPDVGVPTDVPTDVPTVSIVRAKFVCNGATDRPDTDEKCVDFTPVTDGSEENRSFASHTPNGELHLIISDNTPASEFFITGEEYYLDFTKASQ